MTAEQAKAAYEAAKEAYNAHQLEWSKADGRGAINTTEDAQYWATRSAELLEARKAAFKTYVETE